MEHLEDKIIREKIDNLDSLPAGYQPSVSGKWELLESAMPQKRNNKRHMFAIAASLLLLLGISGLFFKNSLNQQQEIAFGNQINKPKKNNKIEAHKTQDVGIVKTEKIIVSNTETAAKTRNSNPQFSTPFITTYVNDSAFKNIITEDVPLVETITLASTATTKKSKKLFVEIDFNDPQQIQPKTENKLADNKVKFKVNILKSKNKFTEPSQPSTVLKISKEFPLNN